MNVDDALQSLRNKPRPEPGPFFTARVMHSIESGARRRTPVAMIVFWLLLASFSAALLLPTACGVPLAVLAIACIVFPERVVGLVAPLFRS